MARRGGEDSASKSTSENSAAMRKVLIKDVQVDRLVEALVPNASGAFTDSKVQVRFTVKGVEAKVVSVAGTFNGWDTKGTPLLRKGDAWEATIPLPRGKYEYRFVVDGRWISDPNALETVANPYGSHNSVLSV